MREFRFCKFKDGTIKDFEDVLAGDVFQMFEPDGMLLNSQDARKFTWFLATNSYHSAYNGFGGVWMDDKKLEGGVNSAKENIK